MASKFRQPKEFPKKKARVPISARLDKDVKTSLEKAAKGVGLTFGELIENVLEDYSKYLASTNKGRRR